MTDTRIKLGLTYEHPVDPPDEPCICCGGVIASWVVNFFRKDEGVMLCRHCSRPPYKNPGYPRFQNHSNWRTELGSLTFRAHVAYADAGSILWLLEEEIGKKTGSRPRGRGADNKNPEWIHPVFDKGSAAVQE